jgi:nitrogen fixation NifU-like protein
MKSTSYSEKTLDHFRNPRNVGTLEGEDVAIGRVGNPVCGDLMEIYVRIEEDHITGIRFQTFGCGSAVATSSMIHCSNLAADALHDAIKNWREGVRLDVTDPDSVPTKTCSTPAEEDTTPLAGQDEFLGKGLFRKSPEPEDIEGTRVLVFDTGQASLELAMELIEHTGRVVFMTASFELPGDAALRSRAKRSDVKLLFQSKLLEVGGEGEVEKVRVHDLDEDEEYELFIDSLIILH